MSLPDSLKPYRQQAKELLESISEIIFAGGTYQVSLHCPEEIWVFLQFAEDGGVTDLFCSCEEEDTCSHMAAAYMSLSDADGQLLHQRFADCFWNRLFWVLYNQQEPVATDSGWNMGAIQVISQEPEIRNIFEDRVEETEETSIKFSQLDPEELEMWREGNPSRSLAYSLSEWSDLAKTLFLYQEKGQPYQITLDQTTSLPKELKISFPNISLQVKLTESDWELLIETLHTVDFPIAVHQSEDLGIKAMRFDESSGTLFIEKKDSNGSESVGLIVGHWRFDPEKGFVARKSCQSPYPEELQGEALVKALDQAPDLFRRYLQPLRVRNRPIELSYQGSVRENGDILFLAYLVEPGDLQQKGFWDLHSWIYLPNDGFYRIQDRFFSKGQQLVAQQEVEEFVTQNRGQLAKIPGFSVHVAEVESRLDYAVDLDGNLSFFSRLGDLGHGMQDYGRWVWIPSQGFHPKADASTSLPVQPGTALAPAFVPVFIRMNKEELSLIPGFFGISSPISGASLSVELDKENQVVVTPRYSFRTGYSEENVRFYDEYTYVEEEGFVELPTPHRLPERFRVQVKIAGSAIVTFLDYELDLIKSSISELDPNLRKPDQIELVVERIEKQKKGIFQLRMHYRTSVGTVSIEELRKGIEKKKRFLFTQAGLIDLRDTRFRWIRELSAENFVGADLCLTTMQLLRLDALDPLVTEGTEVDSELRAILSAAAPEELNLTGLVGRLRSYQVTGVRWLTFLYEHGLSGLLCDDMGLGKTHEAMALMAVVRNTNSKAKYLVVCPTSVIYSWQEKLAKYMPHLTVHTHHGTGRSLEESDILLTSFGIWRNEVETLKSLYFDLAIFDEVQIAKNRSSRTNKALRQVRASMKLGLTGTPIENALWELKALFDLVLPGYLPTDTEFRDRFVYPIEKQVSEKAKESLLRLIRPFILRRRKVDVLQDLPPKTEEVAHCSLSKDQQALYTQAVAEMRGELLPQLTDSGSPMPYVHIFALLTRLKQICDHPAIPMQDVENYHLHESGKWDLFVELLNEALSSGQKVVVFTQYLTMLDIMELYLRQTDVPYASIRGSTRDRPAELRRFNNDPDCLVFLGSLQAIGLGVDLTAGSVVIHYDRWWNAAREDQATDRVHRIGQTRGVQVFKLITLNTFEERIDELIRKKAKLMNEIVTVDDQTLIKTLTREELLDLLGG